MTSSSVPQSSRGCAAGVKRKRTAAQLEASGNPVDKSEAQASDQPGPCNLKEYFLSFKELFQSYWKDDQSRSMLAKNLQEGVDIITDYSGVCCPEFATDIIQHFATQEKVTANTEDGSLFYLRTMSEPNSACQSIAKESMADGDELAPCIFGNVEVSLTEDASRHLDLIESLYDGFTVDMPPELAGASSLEAQPQPHQGLRMKYLVIAGFLMRFTDTAYNQDVTAWCHMHECHCPVWGAQQGRLRMMIAGTTCVGASALGKTHDALSHESMRSFHVWAGKVRALKPFVVIHECVPQWPHKVMQWWFSDLYSIERLEVSPVDMGFPARRPRAWTWMFLKKGVQFSGSPAHFMKMHRMSVELSADDLYCAPEKEVLKEFTSLVERRQGVASPAFLKKECKQDWVKHYAPGGQARLQAALDKQAVGQGLSGAFIVDVDQNAEAGSKPGATFPTMPTHGTFYSATHKRHAVALEHFVVQGFPAFEELEKHLGVRWRARTAVQESSPADARRMAGNSMHLFVMYSQILYILAHLALPGDPVSEPCVKPNKARPAFQRLPRFEDTGGPLPELPGRTLSFEWEDDGTQQLFPCL